MTGVYATIANGGALAAPWAVRKAWLRGDGAAQPLFAQPPGRGAQAMPSRQAAMLTSMLAEVVRRGTGARAALGDRPAAGKTGTTQAARDAWFIGYTADHVTGVWMGYDDNTPLTGVTGGGLPAEIWRETMLRLHRGLAPRPLGGVGRADGPIARIADDADDVARSVLADVIGFFSRGLVGGEASAPPAEKWER